MLRFRIFSSFLALCVFAIGATAQAAATRSGNAVPSLSSRGNDADDDQGRGGKGGTGEDHGRGNHYGHDHDHDHGHGNGNGHGHHDSPGG